jgi:16S rRNA A1518/A1519 N6-dimethyltransferase RsmA/KsgA/DIM1 with predicted DNA glycosylase/AP lyase activity
MSKTIKLSEKEQRETEILSKRIMPKTDFEKVIEHDKLYYNTLNQALEFNIVKQDILGKKCQKLLANQTKDSIEANIHTLTDWAETQLKVLDMQGKLRIQQKLIEDKETHFHNVFMPQFTKESKEANENFKQTFKKVKELLQTEGEGYEDILKKMVYELTWWEKCNKEQQANEEFLIQIYKPLKRLISAYEDRTKEIEENNKYKQ